MRPKLPFAKMVNMHSHSGPGRATCRATVVLALLLLTGPGRLVPAPKARASDTGNPEPLVPEAVREARHLPEALRRLRAGHSRTPPASPSRLLGDVSPGACNELLWMTPSEPPRALQASECSERLFDPT